jgi:hypothetical protein
MGHLSMFYADGVIILVDSINITKKSTLAQIDASKEVVLDVDIEKTKYILMSHH